jgi:hypothetical protein
MTRDTGWGPIKAKLKGLSAADLVTLIRDIYQASPENRHFLRGRLAPTAAHLEGYRGRVVDAVYPDPFSRRPVRIGEAERLIRHYRLSTGDETGAVDLMVSLVEAGTEQAVDLGFGDDESYFASLERVLEGVMKATCRRRPREQMATISSRSVRSTPLTVTGAPSKVVSNGRARWSSIIV